MAARGLIHYDGFCSKLDRAQGRWTPAVDGGGHGGPLSTFTPVRVGNDHSVSFDFSAPGAVFDAPSPSPMGGYGGHHLETPVDSSLRDFELAHTHTQPRYGRSSIGDSFGGGEESASGYRYANADARASNDSFYGGHSGRY